MSDYISRELALADFEQCNRKNSTWTPQRVKTLLMRIPSADVEPVRHGRKIEDGDIGGFWLCSLCGEWLPYGANYCPSCGARMDGESE
jgi:hypothetical protein